MTQLFYFPECALTCHIIDDHIIFYKMKPLAYWKYKK